MIDIAPINHERSEICASLGALGADAALSTRADFCGFLRFDFVEPVLTCFSNLLVS